MSIDSVLSAIATIGVCGAIERTVSVMLVLLASPLLASVSRARSACNASYVGRSSKSP
ncbi:MAG: hypothetical protein BWZ10_03273 [candidate division BRC1 bacterium ADurb.BinA364]|nr:MAG: hypothetical protein BWZ10_03273 [candidate division BRC1 bacterium ADurb.BinA364]